jgi:hypothetical protein
MSGLTKRVRGANTPLGTNSAGVFGGGHSTVQGAPPSADLVTKLLSAFTDDAGDNLGGTVAEEGDR